MHIFWLNVTTLFFILNTIDVLGLVYSNFCANKIIFQVRKRSFMEFKYLICVKN